MIPNNELSSSAVVGGFSFPVKQPGDFLVDWELAGIYLNDPSQGLHVKLWRLDAVPNNDSGLIDLVLSAPGGVSESEGSRTIFSAINVTEVALAFDQNMNPFVAYHQGEDARLYWYDPTIPGMTHTTMPAGVRSMRCTLDDKRDVGSDGSDIVLSYVRAGNLYARYQRERYTVEHVMRAGVGANAVLVSLAMNVGSRLQWRLRRYELVDDPGALVSSAPFLGDVVFDLYNRSGLAEDQIDVSRLFGATVEGFKVATEGGADVMVQSLQSAFFFDPSESDKMLRAVVRGGSPKMDIGSDALVARDDDALTIDRAQEAELLRKVNVTMIDSSIDYTTNKQTAERRSNKIKAKAESSIEIPLTASPDFHATVAMRRLNIAWGEMETYEFELPIAYSALVPTDVIVLTDKNGKAHRMRIMEIEEDGGTLIVKASKDAPWVYDANAVGVKADPPAPTTPGLVGDTVVAVLDIPVLRDQDDELGYYVGARGTGRGWRGAEIQMSTDGGVSVGQSLQMDVPAVIGVTATDLLQEVGAEYLSQQRIVVAVPEPLESIDYEQLLRYGNKAAVRRADGSWEVLQFQTATQLSETMFELSGLVRGRYATEPLAVAAGAMFVLIDDSLVFAQVQQWMTGTTISYRGVSYGQDSDEADWSSFAVDEPQSQQEWPVHYVRAVRNSSNAVTVSWVGRGRLGVETAPRQGKYFAGYRVSYSDGFTADVTNETHTRASTPSGVTVTVAAINTITGPGPASEVIPT
ncbi:phage tail protein [Stenotrophomonas pigmentata]|uniref:phage tail protein n=1 Tax=Stenotrophomonas pigmentata TaxID=3055080 RepID=UPI0026F271A8|nr:phage tail protein [Stenotrophomonas sp. 610A2]